MAKVVVRAHEGRIIFGLATTEDFKTDKFAHLTKDTARIIALKLLDAVDDLEAQEKSH